MILHVHPIVSVHGNNLLTVQNVGVTKKMKIPTLSLSHYAYQRTDKKRHFGRIELHCTVTIFIFQIFQR